MELVGTGLPGGVVRYVRELVRRPMRLSGFRRAAEDGGRSAVHRQVCDYIPIPGDIIFFDWEGDGVANHVGIVEKVDGDFIYTIEGNTDDQCRENRYYLISTPIFGYGLPQY